MPAPLTPRTEAPPLSGVARLFHALSDPTRLRLVELLAGGERCVCELTGPLGASQSRLSFHLKTLKEAGLVADRPEGRWVYYRLRREPFEEMAGALEALQEAKAGVWKGITCC
jgi:ArsR family transcriptional regulator